MITTVRDVLEKLRGGTEMQETLRSWSLDTLGYDRLALWRGLRNKMFSTLNIYSTLRFENGIVIGTPFGEIRNIFVWRY
jgi:hypothetical protein